MTPGSNILIFFPDTCKGLILALDLVEVHILYSLCTHLHWTTIPNFHSLDQVIGPQYLLNTNLVLFLNTCLGNGLLHLLLLVLGMDLLRPCCLHLVLVMSMHIWTLVSTYILLSILVNDQDYLICILWNQFISPFHRYVRHNVMSFVVVQWLRWLMNDILLVK